MTKMFYLLLAVYVVTASSISRQIRGSRQSRQLMSTSSRKERPYSRLLLDIEGGGYRLLDSKSGKGIGITYSASQRSKTTSQRSKTTTTSKSKSKSKSKSSSGKSSGTSSSGTQSNSGKSQNTESTPSSNTEQSFCSCTECTEEVLSRKAGDYTCGERMEYLLNHYAGAFSRTRDACVRVAGSEFPDVCGACNPEICDGRNNSEPDFYCGCKTCDKKVWEADAEGFSCGVRISWAAVVNQQQQEAACIQVAETYPKCSGCNSDQCQSDQPAPRPTKKPQGTTPAPISLRPTNPVLQSRDDFNDTAEFRCGCSNCSQAIWGTDTGDGITCGSRIDWLVTQQGMSELDACRQIAGKEYPSTCGPTCDPDSCEDSVNPPTLEPTASPQQCPLLTPESEIYCFRNYSQRVYWENVWGKYRVEAKHQPENIKCGPNNNLFDENNVNVENDELTLHFKKRDNLWISSEVRVVLPPDEMPYTYGHFEFSVKSVVVKNKTSGLIVDNKLPPDLVLGMFTFDPRHDCADSADTYYHEIDIELSRWGNTNNMTNNVTAGGGGQGNTSLAMDGLFIVQPPQFPQYHRFFTGANQNYDQGGHIYGFYWNPTNITWHTTAGGGQTFSYTTQQALELGIEDRIQCLPTSLDIRINLWNFHGTAFSSEMEDDYVVKVVIDHFMFTPSNETGVGEGSYCSKDCQCNDGLSCLGVCSPF